MGADTSESTPPDAPHVLAVDDEVAIHGVLERLLPREGIDVTTCTSGEEALELLDEAFSDSGRDTFDLVLSDYEMPGMGGMELLERVTEEYPQVRMVLLSTQNNAQQAVQAMRKGAVDYIPKPFSTDELVDRIQTILEKKSAGALNPHAATNGEAKAPDSTAPVHTNGHANGTADNPRSVSENGTSKSAAHSNGKHDPDCPRFVGEHQSVEELRAMVGRIAGSQAPVFVQGESGTGKEILSRLVHERSNRSGGPYVPINCAALPSDLVESHLFGHVEGAFTGAVDDMTGAFEKADGGTLLLDEITEIAPSIQAKLLRVLQTQEFQKVGSSDKMSVDVRVIATSNRDMEEAVEDGTFREDLYHRLSVFPLHVPPLRGRLSDIPVLAEHFVEKYTDQYGLPTKKIAPGLLQRFQTHDWPGNVRELENVIHRGVVMAGEREYVEEEDVLDHFSSGHRANGHAQSGAAGTVVAEITAEGSVPTVAEMERKLILNTLAEEEVSQKEAAEKLGISARTIRNKLKDYREQGFSI
jgi:DNA-binding NtrC family response regulator